MSFRNRCLIAGAAGPVSLSIPLEDGRNQRIPVSKVSIAGSEPWRAKHWKSIQSAYNRAPFFEYYRDDLELLFRKKTELLMDWNLECLNWVKSKLDWPPGIRVTESPEQESDAKLWEDHRNEVLPKNYQEKGLVKYQQTFEEKTGFLPNLSVLDLLFNLGRAAGAALVD